MFAFRYVEAMPDVPNKFPFAIRKIGHTTSYQYINR
jgi:hypothetical protein